MLRYIDVKVAVYALDWRAVSSLPQGILGTVVLEVEEVTDFLESIFSNLTVLGILTERVHP